MLIHTPPQVEALMHSALAQEEFGPFSQHPYFALQLDDEGDNAHRHGWLRDLPCPVIGIGIEIGAGPLGPSCDAIFADENEAERAADNIAKWPMAAMVLVQHLRASEHLDMHEALITESLAYATLQQGPEFARWLAETDTEPEIGPTGTNAAPLLAERKGDALHLTMNDPETRNAIGTAMRDALAEALDLALTDPAITKITMSGEGRCFSSGGKLSEFGQVSDPATAHWIRSLRLPAHRLARLSERLGERLHVHVGGAAIGAGAEMAAFAGRVTASEDAWFQLPELKYGLIPGAGGTVSLPRRIGRQRTAQMALSMKRIDAQKALDYGLVDEIV